MADQIGMPGIETERTATFRRLLMAGTLANLLAAPKAIRGALSRDTGNTGDLDVLRAGLLMGKITTGAHIDKYAPSVLGKVQTNFDGSTSLVVDPACATEITRRLGASGTLKLTGAKAAGGVVRTQTLTYASLAPSAAANEAQTVLLAAAATDGTFRLKVPKADGTSGWTAEIEYDANGAEITLAVNVVTGVTDGIVCTIAGGADFGDPALATFAFSGEGFLALPHAMIEIDGTALIGYTTASVSRTVLGGAATGTITCTALGVAEVQTLTPGACTAGTYHILYTADDGSIHSSAAIAFNADDATVKTAFRLVHAEMAAVDCTSSGSAGLDDGTVIVTWPTTGATAGPHNLIECVTDDLLDTAAPVEVITTRGDTGVNGDYIAGSLIQPVDGSATPLCLVNEGYGIKVTDEDAVSIDVPFPEILIGGSIRTAGIINYPYGNVQLNTLAAWIKAQLRAVGNYVFDDDF